MSMPAADYLQALVALTSIVNPVAAVPLFMAFTASEPRSRKRVAVVASVSVACVLVGAMLLGEPLLAAFGITVPAFRIAGGIVVFTIALSMLQSSRSRVQQTPEEQQDGIDRENPAIVPLAIPLLAGPGSISTMIVYAHETSGLQHRVILIGIAVLVGVLVWVCLSLGAVIAARISPTVLSIVNRLMGLITAAIAVQMVLSGLREAMPGVGR